MKLKEQWVLNNKNLFLLLLLILLGWGFYSSQTFLENNEVKVSHNLNQTRSVSSVETLKQNLSTTSLKPTSTLKNKQVEIKKPTLFKTFKPLPEELEEFNNRHSDEPSGFTMELSGLSVDFEAFKKVEHPLDLPDKLQIPLPNGKTIQVEQKRVDYKEKDNFVWVGQVDGKLNQWVHLSFYKSTLYGGIHTPSETHRIEYLSGNKYLIRKVDESLWSPLVDDVVKRPEEVESKNYNGSSLNDKTSEFLTKTVSASALSDTPPTVANAKALQRVTIDLLVVYPLVYISSRNRLVPLINNMVAMANTIHNNSQTGVNIRLTRFVGVSYTGDISGASDYMKKSSEIQRLRAETKSDLVSMYGAPGGCTLLSGSPFSAFGNCSNLNLARVTGRSIGGQRNKKNSYYSRNKLSGYNFGYVLDNNGLNSGNKFSDKWFSEAGGGSGTIMAFTYHNRLYFSSAEPVQGVPRGGATMDNAKYIRENAPRIAAYRQSSDNTPTPPYIISQPQSATVEVNDNLSLAVDASGEGPLNYQWYKNNVAISGETNKTLLINNVSQSDEGTYKVKVSNAYGLVYSNAVTVNVRLSPIITLQPQNTIIRANDNLSLSVNANGENPLTYQWYKNNVAISGETNKTLLINNVSQSDEGTYKVKVSNAYGLVYSNAVTVNVRLSPIITLQPQNTIIRANDNLSLSVNANEENPLTYQWYKNSVEISDQTSKALLINNASQSDQGIYKVKVSNAHGLVYSKVAAVIIRPSPVITLQPQNTTIQVNNNLNLSVRANGENPLTYQWYKNNAAISGETNKTLLINNVNENNEGTYKVKVSNAYGLVYSNEVAVRVEPSSITISKLPIITLQPQNVIINANESLNLSVNASSKAPLSYQWYKNTQGSSKALLGQTNNLLSIPNASSSHEGWYVVRVYNSHGYVDSKWVKVNIVLTLNTGPPIIVSQPQNTTINANDNLSLSVSAGGASLSYQWYRSAQGGSKALLGETTNLLSIPNASSFHEGWYVVRVHNSYGYVDSSWVKVYID